jgi:excisionase family DNA binding protein
MSNEIFATERPPQLLTARELATALKLCPDSVRRAAKAGKIPFLRTGGAIRFNPEHVAQIMRDGFQCPRKTN